MLRVYFKTSCSRNRVRHEKCPQFRKNRGFGGSIVDVANSKCHEILIFFTRTIQEISKVVCKKTMSETCAFISSLCCMKRAYYSKCMLRKVSWTYCMTDFFWKQLCWFLRCSAGNEKSRFYPAVGGVSN